MPKILRLMNQEKLRAGGILQGACSQFGAKRGDEERQRSEKLELEKPVHVTKPYVKKYRYGLGQKPLASLEDSLGSARRFRPAVKQRQAQRESGQLFHRWLIVRRPFDEPAAAVEQLEVVGDHGIGGIERTRLLEPASRRAEIAA
ncbi:hypothetical protein MTX20_34855 [Bradyrhizobium sp. ISRA435]|nr:hypothetical protein MTX20_34855 [Bradyrhizobium sp. ISRA435]